MFRAEYSARTDPPGASTVVMTPLGISVLALLNERPMHPYEMYQLLIERHEDRLVKVRPGSLYHTVERLVAHEFIEVTGTERAGNRPERTTYAITDVGREALTKRIADLIRTPVNEYPSFPVVLGEAHNIDRAEVVEHLRMRITNLNGSIAELDAWLAGAKGMNVPEAYLLAGDYQRAMFTTERDWLSRLVDRIESKDLEWPRT
jgi:DNA-binding PadR family transcriptional regulator